MKIALLALLMVLLLCAPFARAEPEKPTDHSAHHPEPAQATGGAQHEPAQHLRANLKTMQELMAQVSQSTDLEEKKRLLRVHMLAMQEQIRTIRAAAAEGDDHPQGVAAEEGKGDNAKKASMMSRGMMGGGMMKMHKKTQQRIEALEQLLEQLIDHEAQEDELPGR